MFASLRVEDPEQRLAAVRLCSDLPLADPEFVRDNGGWVLELPPTGLARLEGGRLGPACEKGGRYSGTPALRRAR